VVSDQENDEIRFLASSYVFFLCASVFQFSGCTQLSAKLTSRLKHLLIRISLGKETRAGSCKAVSISVLAWMLIGLGFFFLSLIHKHSFLLLTQ